MAKVMNWRIRNHAKKVAKYVNDILERRMDAVSIQMFRELQKVLSAPGPSKPGQPPGITRTPHSQRVPGGLMKSIGWYKDNTPNRLRRRIGTPLKRGYWLEMGVAGGVTIRPVRARALLVPIPKHVAELIRQKKDKKGGGSGKMIGLVQHPTGEWFALMRYVIQGPIAPRPWLKTTFFKNLRKIGLTLSQRIN